MDVKCERCSTEYEFDDALVSGRGTTVKCTNCGHKFKIRRAGTPGEDFWNIETADGRVLVFTTLRELQRAIRSKSVEREDMLWRGSLPPRPLGQIPELAPFFQHAQNVPLTSSAPPAGEVRPANSEVPLSEARRQHSTQVEFPPPPPPGSITPVAPTASSLLEASGKSEDETITARFARDQGADLAALVAAGEDTTTTRRRRPADTYRMLSPPPPPPPPPPPAAFEATPAFPPPPPILAVAVPPAVAVSPVAAPVAPTPPPAVVARPVTPAPPSSNLLPDADELDGAAHPRASLPDAPAGLGRRRPVGGFVVAAVVLAGAGVVAAFWARQHLGAKPSASSVPSASVSAEDPRVAAFLSAGEKALGEGKLDVAKENFDKASALADKTPQVALGVARLAAARADVPWLRVRLLPEGAADEQRVTRESLAELGAAARKAADDALAVAPGELAALRAKIDALRITGDREGARALVSRVASSGAQPETAYVLAALDLAEPEPLWPTVIERLRLAAAAESGPGRARAGLAYALAKSGDFPGANAEVERLAAMAHQHPLLPQLRAFVERSKSGRKVAVAPDAGAPASASGTTPTGKAAGGPAPIPSDPRVMVAQGETARQRGDYERARTLFNAALDKNPNDSEAMAGLGAIAHAQNDLNGARATYKRVLSINPSYLPALVGVADVDWDSGNRVAAMKTYKEIIDRFPESAYPMRVKQRVDAMTPSRSSSEPGDGKP